jgi:2-oxoglutarate ferredoxin oxidoreductase subunit gamma
MEEPHSSTRIVDERITVAGFGGQGIVLMGKLLAHAGLLEGKNVTCLPAYGPEMRGGTANCMVTISTSKIGSPYVTNASTLIAMNQPSLERFESTVEPRGLVLVNNSLVNREVARKDITVASVQATKEAEELGDVRAANMLALGALTRVRPIVGVSALIQALEKSLPEGRRGMLALDERAIQRGCDAVRIEVTVAG